MSLKNVDLELRVISNNAASLFFLSALVWRALKMMSITTMKNVKTAEYSEKKFIREDIEISLGRSELKKVSYQGYDRPSMRSRSQRGGQIHLCLGRRGNNFMSNDRSGSIDRCVHDDLSSHIPRDLKGPWEYG